MDEITFDEKITLVLHEFESRDWDMWLFLC